MPTKNKKLILLLAIGVFSILNTEAGIVGIIPHVSAYHDVSITKASTLISAFAMVIAISALIIPLLLSKFNRKLIMLIALGTFTLGTTFSVFTHNFDLLLISRIIPAILHPAYISIAMTLAANFVEPKDAQKAISMVFVGATTGSLIGVPMSNFLANQFSLQISLAYFALVNAMAFIITLIYMPSVKPRVKLSYGQQVGILKKAEVWIVLICTVLLNGAIVSFNSYISAYLTDVAALAGNIITTLLLILGIARIFGTIFAGYLLSVKSGPLSIILPLTSLSIYLSLYFSGDNLIIVTVLLGLFGMLGGMSGNFNQYMISSAGKNSPEFSNGLFISTSNLGTTAGTTIGGIFIGINNQTQDCLLGSVLLVITGFMFILLRNKLIGKKYSKIQESQT